ncbi:hypothetical protein PCANC_11769 [Puccinia coronata f. sp. avenae]|uniref:Uncharacterized protein n=1 Tax=Puccinia coronata f. sp. avenae TaxID=200324 RepID=A0A2N5UY08_9BASI|nr:hypothetical protein PCANC_11769 [Puccinia coronata f. sp. avenae]
MQPTIKCECPEDQLQTQSQAAPSDIAPQAAAAAEPTAPAAHTTAASGPPAASSTCEPAKSSPGKKKPRHSAPTRVEIRVSLNALHKFTT